MERMIACCGLDCAACEAYIAQQNDDNELRRKTADLWGRQLDVEVDPAGISCDGCLNSGQHLDDCGMCGIRKCCLEKGLSNCAECDQYICDTLHNGLTFLSEVLEMGPMDELEAKKNLFSIRAGKCPCVFSVRRAKRLKSQIRPAWRAKNKSGHFFSYMHLLSYAQFSSACR